MTSIFETAANAEEAEKDEAACSLSLDQIREETRWLDYRNSVTFSKISAEISMSPTTRRFLKSHGLKLHGIDLFRLFLDSEIGLQRVAWVVRELVVPLLDINETPWRALLSAFMAVIDHGVGSRELRRRLHIYLGLGTGPKNYAEDDGSITRKQVVTFTVPAFFWSDGAEFLEAAYNISRMISKEGNLVPKGYDLEQVHKVVCSHTQHLRMRLSRRGVFVGHLPLDFGPHSQPIKPMSSSENGSDTQSASVAPGPFSPFGPPPLGMPLGQLPRFGPHNLVFDQTVTFWDGAVCDSKLLMNVVKNPRIHKNIYPSTKSICWWRDYLPVHDESPLVPRWPISGHAAPAPCAAPGVKQQEMVDLVWLMTRVATGEKKKTK